MSRYFTIIEESVAEYEEKRSKFIATLRHCDTEAQAMAFIDEMRSKYWDARHNCFAYSVEEGKLSRFSDDGEPHGTAGKPILDVILGNELKNVVIVVTRYFGGVLLGTGGLVRAYSTSAKEAVSKAQITEMIECTRFLIECDYQNHQKLTYLIDNENGQIDDTEFTDRVIVKVIFKDADIPGFLSKLTESFSAKIEAKELEKTIFPFKDKKNCNS